MNTRERRADRARVVWVTELVAHIIARSRRPSGCNADKLGWRDALHAVVRVDRAGRYSLDVLVAVGLANILWSNTHTTVAAVRDLARIASRRHPRLTPQARQRLDAAGFGGYVARGQQPGAAAVKAP